MNRRRPLRRGILVAAALYLAALGFLYRKPAARPVAQRDDVAADLLREATGKQNRYRFDGFEYEETRANEGRYRLRAEEALGFLENGSESYWLKDALFESLDEGAGRSVALWAPRARLSRGDGSIRVYDGVRLVGAAGSTLRGASFRYEPVGRQFVSDGPVWAMQGRLVANADAGTLELHDGALKLEGTVRVRGRLEDGAPVVLAAPSAELRRSGEFVARGGVTLSGTSGVLRATEVLRAPEPGGGDILRASGAARLLIPPGEDARVPSAVEVEGDTIDLRRNAAGVAASLLLDAPSGGRVLLAPSSKAGARRIRSTRLEGGFVAGRIHELASPGPVEIAEALANRPGLSPGSGLRTLRAGRARLLLMEDGETLDVANLENDVELTEGTRARLAAPSGTLRGADDLAVFSGDARSDATYRDERGTLDAASISLHRSTEIVEAAGKVRATYAGGGDRDSLLGGAPGEPFHSESETLRLDGPAKELKLGGGVRAWQKENVLRSRSLVLDDRNRKLRAEGDVRTVFRREVPSGTSPSASRKTTPETINGSGDVLTHLESEHLVRIEGNTSVVSGTWVIHADVTDVRLAADRSVEFAEARGAVTLEDRLTHRRGSGEKATWRSQADVVSLSGSPAIAYDEKGNRLTGALLTFRQGQSRVDVETSDTIPSGALVKPEGS